MKIFSRKKKVSNPANSRRAANSFGLGANSSLPTAADWQSFTGGGGSSQPILNLIHSYLSQDRSTPWRRTAVLGQLYFLSNTWLTRNRNTPSPRTPYIESFYEQVVAKLCYALGCSTNTLPQKLEDYWGRVMGDHGYMIDQQQIANGADSKIAVYLSRADLAKYEIEFKGTTAYMLQRSQTPSGHQMIFNNEVLADSTNVGWEDGRGMTAPAMMENGFAGFAMSMGRKFYMGHHRGCFAKNFFHSSYLAGDTIQCSGTILIQNGIVKAIKNDSGHYRPTLEHLLNVVQALQMNGVQPASVVIKAVPYSWTDQTGRPGTTELVTDGQELINRRGGGQGLMNRFNNNQQHKQQRSQEQWKTNQNR